VTPDPTPVLDVGGTHVTAALVDLDSLRVVDRRTHPLDADGDAETIIGTLTRAAGELQTGPGRVWGVAMPGPFDYAGGRGSFDGVGKFAEIAGVDLKERLGRELGTTRDDVRFLNDADAYALGEWDAHDRPERLCCVTLGTGVGGGFVQAGRILTDDPRVPAGGDLYHQRWDGAPLEEHVSRRALLREFGVPGLDVRDIAERAIAGDVAATDLFSHAMQVLAHVLAPWISSFRPQVVVVGGSIAQSWSLVGPPLQRGLQDAVADAPPVRPSQLQQDAPLVGAAEFVRTPTASQGRTHR